MAGAGVLLPSRITPVIEALQALEAAEAREEQARGDRQHAEVVLAEIVGVERRDKDTGFEAEHAAKELIIESAVLSLPPQRGENR